MRRTKKGFTLIELIVVMAILAILVLLAAPKYINYTKDADVTAMQTDVKVLSSAVTQFYIKNESKHPYDPAEAAVPKVAADAPVAGEIGNGTFAGIAALTATPIISLEEGDVRFLIPASLEKYVKSPRNPISDYFIVTKVGHAYYGEIFYKDMLVNSEKQKCNGLYIGPKPGP